MANRRVGYHASHEQTPPGLLLEQTQLAEHAGFAGAMCSDHFAPWGTWDAEHLFHEYFHAETGQGLGAQHQTGWSALIAEVLEELAGDRP